MPDTDTDTDTESPLADLEPGEVPVARPFDDVELEFYGLAENSASPMLIHATVERDGGDALVTYEIVELSDDEDAFIAEPFGDIRNTRAEDAIREAGGKIRKNKRGRMRSGEKTEPA